MFTVATGQTQAILGGPQKNIPGHIAYTSFSWPNHKQWPHVGTMDLGIRDLQPRRNIAILGQAQNDYKMSCKYILSTI